MHFSLADDLKENTVSFFYTECHLKNSVTDKTQIKNVTQGSYPDVGQ